MDQGVLPEKHHLKAYGLTDKLTDWSTMHFPCNFIKKRTANALSYEYTM